jgi:hypothetical protein
LEDGFVVAGVDDREAFAVHCGIGTEDQATAV